MSKFAISSPFRWLHRELVIDKLNSITGVAAMIGLALLIASLFTFMGAKVSLLIVAVLVALPIAVMAVFNHQLGITFFLLVAFSIQLVGKYTTFPMGTLMDALLYAMLFGLLINRLRTGNRSFLTNRISVWVLIWVYANLFQVLNPIAVSKLAWLYTVRSMALLILLYFIAYNAFDSIKKIRGMIHFIISLSFFACLYAFKQEYIGFSAAETAWLHADEERFQLINQWTRMRIFSILNDPTTFGIMMAYMAVFCFILASGRTYSTRGRILLAVIGLLMTAANAFTGTRTSFVLVPIGFFLYVLMYPTREVLIAIGCFFLLGTAAMMKSSSNPLIFRIQSAFKPSKDESVAVRMRNQAFIQPWIQSHPVGAGLGSTGLWGRRFSPDSWLARFPHDSGYVRIAVEQGWIGLIIYLSFLFVILRQSIYYFFRVRDPDIKNLYLAVTVAIFILAVANYPQEAIVQLPTSIVFYIFIAVVARLKDFDPAFAKPEETPPQPVEI